MYSIKFLTIVCLLVGPASVYAAKKDTKKVKLRAPTSSPVSSDEYSNYLKKFSKQFKEITSLYYNSRAKGVSKSKVAYDKMVDIIFKQYGEVSTYKTKAVLRDIRAYDEISSNTKKVIELSVMLDFINSYASEGKFISKDCGLFGHELSVYMGGNLGERAPEALSYAKEVAAFMCQI